MTGTTPFPIILSAPSGGGKTTIARALLASRVDLGYSVSCTTRARRGHEVDGRDYHFLSPDEFQARVASGDFAEWAHVHDRMYGTLRSEVRRVLESGRNVVMDIDVQGAEQFAAAFPESVLIFLLPPSAAVLRERLAQRNTESAEMLALRLRTAREELNAATRYQYVIVNDDLDTAIRRVSAVIDAEMSRRSRCPALESRVQELVDELSRALDATTPV